MCDCMDQVNKQLAVRNTRLTPSVSWNKAGMTVTIRIATEKIDSHKREGPVAIMGQYCPFCGEKQEVKE